MEKALFIGLGSIGQRHLQNLKILYPEIEVIAYRSSTHSHVIKNCQKDEIKSLDDFYKMKSFTNLKEALNEKPNFIFICNPSSKHINFIKIAIEHSIDFFIEKPLSHNMKNVNLLIKETSRKNLISMVGYQARFHPAIQKIKEIIELGNLGDMISSHFSWGTYLPSHHPYEDYTKGYAASQKLGGGVTLGLIHEIDLIYYFFGAPDEIVSTGGKLSNLKTDADDTITATFKYKNKGRLKFVNLFLSYAQTYETRDLKIQFTEGTILFNWLDSKLHVYNKVGHKIIEDDFNSTTRGDLFLSEMKHFIDSVRSRKESIVNIEEGANSLAIAVRILENL